MGDLFYRVKDTREVRNLGDSDCKTRSLAIKEISEILEKNKLISEAERMHILEKNRRWHLDPENSIESKKRYLGYSELLSKNSFENEIKPELVFRHVGDFVSAGRFSIRDFSESLLRILEESDTTSKVQWLELRPFEKNTDSGRISTLIEFIEHNRSPVEMMMSKLHSDHGKHNNRIRLGLVDKKLYLRSCNTNEFDWMSLYEKEMFHFVSPELKSILISEAKNRLGIGATLFGRLVGQITGYNRKVFEGKGENSDLQRKTTFLKGATLSLILDTCNLQIQDIQPEILFIGRSDRNGIRNPRFSKDDRETRLAFARFFGCGLSDGTIDMNHVFSYFDSQRERIEIVKSHFGFLGDTDVTERVCVMIIPLILDILA